MNPTMEIPLDCGLLVPVINIENCQVQGTDPSLKGDCIYTVALSNESNTIETPTNLVHIPVQCDSETYQALTQMSKEPVHLHQPDYSQIANIPIQNKENTHITHVIMDESQEHTLDPPVEVLDPSVLYFNEIYNYLLNKTLPEGSTLSHNKSIKRRSRQYCLKNGILFYGIKCPRKVIILKKDQSTLMENAHIKNQTDKHLNTKEMLEILSKNYYWKTMTSDINKFIKQCNQCIIYMSKSGSALSKNELLDPALSRVWREVELQLLGPYTPTLNQNEYIVALIDPATEWITARPLPRENLANRIAAFIYETFILIGFTKLHICGTTQILVEEIDKAFKEYLADLNDFLAHFIVDLNVLKVEKCETKCPWATDLILDFVSNSNSKWDEKLKHFVFAYCCTFTKNTIGSPFLRMFKRLPYNESEENAENISPQISLNRQAHSNSILKCTLCKMEFLNNHLLKIHQKTHNENSQDSSLQVQKKKQRENSRRQTSLKQELADDEELVDDPEELNSDTNIVNENCNENRDRNQRKAKIRANSTFRKNIESSLPKNPEGSLPSGGLTRLEKLMALASKKDNIPIQPENTDVKTSTVAAVKEILESTKEERRFRGANSGLGKATSKELVKKNATVIMACRNIQATNNAIKHIRKSIKTGKLIPMELDLASLKSIKEFVEKILKDFPKIDVLINNAGVCIPPNHNIKTKEGLEINFGVNYLGHFYLTNLLLDRLKESSPSKIVINGSVLQERGEIDFENFNGEKKLPEMTDIWENKAYNDSKLALYYFAKEFVRRNEKLQDVDIYILCPGFVFTNIGQYIHLKWFEYIKLLPRIYFYMKTPTQGAQTILKCATDPSFKNVTGHFFENCEYYDPKINIDNETALKLWKFSEKFCSNKDQ